MCGFEDGTISHINISSELVNKPVKLKIYFLLVSDGINYSFNSLIFYMSMPTSTCLDLLFLWVPHYHLENLMQCNNQTLLANLNVTK